MALPLEPLEMTVIARWTLHLPLRKLSGCTSSALEADGGGRTGRLVQAVSVFTVLSLMGGN